MREDAEVSKCVLRRLQARGKDVRSRLRKYYLKFSSDAEARRNKPANVSQENWDELCDYWSNPLTQVYHLIPIYYLIFYFY